MFDTMHYEKKLAINVLKIILGEKYTKKVEHDLQALGISQSPWLKLHPTKYSEIIIPITSWVMPKEERFFFYRHYGQAQFTN
jgi:hypothetical protein